MLKRRDNEAMSRPPKRKRKVYFLGAGFGSIAGLPNTAALLSEVHRLAKTNVAWGVSKNLEERLDDAYEFFYPDQGQGFRPGVVDFFSVLASYNQIDRGNLPDGFPDRELLGDLRFAIVHVICERLRDLGDATLQENHDTLDEMIQRGNVVVTTNWDPLVERVASARGVPHRLSGAASDNELLIIKLHGSVDWLLRENAKKALTKLVYAHIEDLLASKRSRARNLPANGVIRTRVGSPGATWRTIKSAVSEPFLVTMTPGKAGSLAPLMGIWEDAYRAISAAATLQVIGYSMPEDDIEIRTLLRASVKRGPKYPKIVVRNPAPDVHVRVRRFIHHDIQSDYMPIAVIAP